MTVRGYRPKIISALSTKAVAHKFTSALSPEADQSLSGRWCDIRRWNPCSTDSMPGGKVLRASNARAVGSAANCVPLWLQPPLPGNRRRTSSSQRRQRAAFCCFVVISDRATAFCLPETPSRDKWGFRLFAGYMTSRIIALRRARVCRPVNPMSLEVMRQIIETIEADVASRPSPFEF